jgi:hypothetical protein
MNKSLKSACVTLALVALAAIALTTIIYSAWALVAWVVGGVLLMGAQDYHLLSRPLKR